MKKTLLAIPIILICFHFMYASDGPQIWTQDLSAAGTVFNGCIVINPTTQTTMYAGTAAAGVYKSTNGGANWTQVNTGLTSLIVWALAISPSNPNVLYCGTSAAGIFKTTDAGATWAPFSAGITQSPQAIQSICINPTDPNTVLIAVWDGNAALDATIGVFKTTNGGTLWASSNVGFGANKNVLTIAANPLKPNTVFAGTSFITPGGTQTGPAYVYKSYDFGNTWANSSNGFGTTTTDIDPVRQLSFSGLDTNTWLAGRFFNTTNGGCWVTTNAGSSWVIKNGGFSPTAPGSLIRSCLINPTNNLEMYIGGDPTTAPPGGVWRTTDGGNSWADFNGGSMPANNPVRALAFRVSDLTLFAGVGAASGTATGQIHEYTFPPLGVSGQNNGVPKEFALKQNYPNPFNPGTVIEYSIPKQAFVTVKVFDMLGREMKTLVNESKNAGSYALNFDASSLSSGVYFYKIIAGDFTATKKMMLVK